MKNRSRYHLILIILIIELISPSCSNEGKPGKGGLFRSSYIDIEAVKTAVVKNLDQAGGFRFAWPGDSIQISPALPEIYRGTELYWVEQDGLTQRADSFFKEIGNLRYDGLDPEYYHLTELRKMGDSIADKKLFAQERAVLFEIRMSDALWRVSHDLLLGRWVNTNKEIKNPNDSSLNFTEILKQVLKQDLPAAAIEQMRPKHQWYRVFRNEYQRLHGMSTGVNGDQIQISSDSLRIGDSLPVIKKIRQRLFVAGGSPTDTVSSVWNNDAFESLKKFQYSHQLKVSGKLDTATLRRLNQGISERLSKLALNMERMRWLKHEFRQPFIWVSIPRMEMDYIEKDAVQFNMKVVIGRPSRPTPALDSKIENVVFSPPWVVPPTIMREEVVPGIARRGGSYLARRGLRAYDRRGRPVSASMINSRNFRQFSIGQSPGYSSSLGEVKFNMPNPWSIYMHDTPHREDFVKHYRAYSSGCVRVQKPKEFAVFLLRDPELYSYEKVDSICKMRKTIFVPMTRNVDVHFVYLTTALDSTGSLMYLKDVYGWDKPL